MNSAATGSPRRRRSRRGSGEELRPQIMSATKRLLASSGDADAVSIRAVADAVGVTAPAIYLHFNDKSELINAVVVDVFGKLDEAMTAAAAGLESPLERLRAYGRAYVDFAVAHPEHYRIATMEPSVPPDPDRPNSAVDDVLASSAFSHIHATVVACMAEGVFAEDDPMPVALDLWAAAHGIASLLITKPHLPWGLVHDAADRVLCTAVLGHMALDLVDGHPTPTAILAWLRGQQEHR